MSDCIFCKIVKGDIPSYKVHEDDSTYAFLDINPTTKGHTIIVPKTHSNGLLDIENESLAKVSIVAKNLAKEYETSLAADGFNMWNNCGKAGEQEVFHFHMHLLPRYKDDNLRLAEPANPNIDVELVHKQITGS